MIRASDLSFAYPGGEEVVSRFHIELAESELLAVIGPNGSGKSTLLKLLAGILSPTAGSVHLDSRRLDAYPRQDLAKRVSYVPQQASVGLPFTVAEIVMMGRHPYQRAFQFETHLDFAVVEQALELTDTKELANRSLSSLSGGEQQRVWIARAIAQDAELLLLDEPTAALDIKHEIKIWEILERLATEKGKIVVGVTHNINLASLFSPRILMLKGGHTVAVGAPRALIRRDLMETVYETPVHVETPEKRPPYVLPERRDGVEELGQGGSDSPPPRPSPRPPTSQGDFRLCAPHSGETRRSVAKAVGEPPRLVRRSLGEGGSFSEGGGGEGVKEPEHLLTPRRFLWTVGASVFLLLAVLVGAPLVGPTRISLTEAFGFLTSASINPDASILFYVRLPRTLLAALVGAALSTSGLTFQSLLRNPLASPFTLGISGGAALATALSIRFGLVGSVGPLSAQTVAALTGSAVAVLLVYLLAQVRGYLAPSTMLLAGVTLHFFFSSLILLVQYTADFTQSYQMVRWVMGGLDIIEFKRLAVITPLVFLGLGALVLFSRRMNIMALGDETARSLGVPVARSRKVAFAAASVATGSAISLAGPVLFVGLMVPHLLRLLLGPDHRLLVPTSIFAGAAFVVICDTVARTVFAPTEIPVGVITALIGGPFFLWLLLRHKLRGIYPGEDISV
jgi:iron complex transport system permease protein